MSNKGKFVVTNTLIHDSWSEFREIIYPKTFTNILIFILSSVDGAKYVSTRKDEQHSDPDLERIVDKLGRILRMDYPRKPLSYFTVDGNETTKTQRATFHKLVRKYFGSILESQTLDGTLFLHLPGDARFSFSKSNFIPLPPKNQVLLEEEPTQEPIVDNVEPFPPSKQATPDAEEPQITSSAQYIPTDILSTIYWYLDGKDLVNCTQVCKRWKEAATEAVYKNAIFMSCNSVEDWKDLGQSYYKLFQKQLLSRMRWFQRGSYRTSSIGVTNAYSLILTDNNDGIRVVCCDDNCTQIFNWNGTLQHKIPDNKRGGWNMIKIDEQTVLSVPAKGKQMLLNVTTGAFKRLRFPLNLSTKIHVYGERFVVASGQHGCLIDIKNELLLVQEVPAQFIFDRASNELLAFSFHKMTAYDITSGKEKRTIATGISSLSKVWHEVFHGYIYIAPHIIRLCDMQVVKTLEDSEVAVAKDKLITLTFPPKNSQKKITLYSLPRLEELGSVFMDKYSASTFKTDGTKLIVCSSTNTTLTIFNLNKIYQKPDTILRGSVWNLMSAEKGILIPCNTISPPHTTGMERLAYDFNEYLLAIATSAGLLLWDFSFHNHEQLKRKIKGKKKNKNKNDQTLSWI